MIKNLYFLSFLSGIVLCLTAQYFACNGSKHILVTDTVTQWKKEIITVTKPSVAVHDTVRRLILSPPHRVYLQVNIDSILRVRDSLRIVLQKNEVKELLVLDTVTNGNDSIHIEADCISASMSVLLRFAPQKQEVFVPERIITKIEKPSFFERAGYFGLGVCTMYGLQQLSKK